MPAANAPDRAKEQEEDPFLKRLEALLALCDSPYEGEQLNAFQAACRLLHSNGRRWLDIASSVKGADAAEARAEVADAAAFDLAAELATKQQRIAELEARLSQGTGIALWNNVAKPSRSRNRVLAAWVLGLNREGQAYLSPKEIDFLSNTVPHWRGELTAKQAAWFQGIVDGVVGRTGMTPPLS